MPWFFKNDIPSSSEYSLIYTSLLIPACNMSLLHSLQGDSVKYNVAPFADCVEAASFKIALASACRTYQCVLPSASSQQFSKPLSVSYKFTA
jgi:hypothetical protein